MNFDCTNYDSENCPKGETFEFSLKLNENEQNVNFLSVGCWGVYCWKGYKDVYAWKEVENEEEMYDRILKNKGMNDKKLSKEEKEELIKSLNIQDTDFFEKETDLYGQKWVVEGMKRYSEKIKTEALFLAGDNVYSYDIPKQKLIDMVRERKYPSKKKYKNDASISGPDIKKQLSKGFTECLNGINVNNFFIALGNHDIQTCEDLNEQLNYGNRYDLKGTYYNVLYTVRKDERDFKINFVVIDTNLFPEKLGDFEKSCNGDHYNQQQMERHMEWVLNVLNEGNSNWNIIIGHVPYKANGHKEKHKTIFNESLNVLFDKIKEEKMQVQLYICADEHNSQILLDNDHKMLLAIVGSGGTVLDYNIQNSEKYKNDTLYMEACFGFLSLSFQEELLKVDFHKTEENKIKNTFSYILNN